MGYSSRAVCISFVCVRLWFRHQGSFTLCNRTQILPRDCVYCGGTIVRRWVSRFVWWVDWPILFPFFSLMWVKYGYCVRARDVGMINKIIENQLMRKRSECRFRFKNCGGSFLSPVLYKSALDKGTKMYGSVFQSSSHFHNASTDDIHMQQIYLWVHWYMYCIISRATPYNGQRLVVEWPRSCRIFMVGRVLLMYFLMKCAMWR